MFRRVVAPFCLLFLCMGLTVQAETLSEDEAFGQTEVTARIEASEAPTDEEQPPGENSEIPSDDNGQKDGHGDKVRTGDRNESVLLLILLLISSIIIAAEKLRNCM